MEYLADSTSDAFRWTGVRDEAERFPRHLDAEKFAREFKFHAAVLGGSAEQMPERYRPAPNLDELDLSGADTTPEHSARRKGLVAKPRSVGGTAPAQKSRKPRKPRGKKPAGRVCKSWVNQVYG